MGQVEELEYVADENVLMGVRKRRLMDETTGEIIECDQIMKRAYGQEQFWKCYLMDFLTILGILDSKQVDVFVYICENTNQGTNLFIGTYKKIRQDVGVSEPTIAKIMKKLQSHNFIKKVSNGVWFVSPRVLVKGDERKKQMLLSYYDSDDPLNEITKPKTKNVNSTECQGQLRFEGVKMDVQVEAS